MNRPTRYRYKAFSLNLIIALAVVVISAGIIKYINYSNQHQLDQVKTAMADGYNAHALTSPFVFNRRTWRVQSPSPWPTSGTWEYFYTADLSGPDAVAAAKSQLSQGGYQVIETSPDETTSDHAALYRDLITGDVKLDVEIGADAPHTFVTGPVTVHVTLSPMQG